MTLNPIKSTDDLLSLFYDACKAKTQFRLGMESEKFGVHSETGASLPYEGPAGIEALFNELVLEHGWEAERDSQSKKMIALRQHGASITLEPGGQLELSGSPQPCVHSVDHELRQHLEEIRPISERFKITWLGLGFTPFARREDIHWVPKSRYGIMRGYLPTRGSKALDMMLRTCTVQVNLDFLDEADAMRKLRIALKAQPITTAMFANSPFYEGRISSNKSERARVWLDVDPDRCGLLPFAWTEKARFADYMNWALTVPMFFFSRNGQVIANTGQTFADFLSQGYEGHHATYPDWELHLSTLFPEVRLKNTLEMRGADAQNVDLARGVTALWKGLLYSDKAMDRAEALLESLECEQVQAARPQIAAKALQATLAGKKLATWAAELLDIAQIGLHEFGVCDERGIDESKYLQNVETLTAQGL
ncbi:MAG: glutamate--cysteine ligase [Myxococcales bacterium]|nr:MAG: glutamate--cysteine ligase [Myxococcales bacterium]